MRALLIVTSLLTVAVAPSPARAEDDPKAAKMHFAEGMKRYNLGRFKEARKDFEDAYLAKPDPVFLFNIGQCHRMLGEPEEAANSYRAYLRANPDAPNRADVEKLIAEASREVERKNAERARMLPPQQVQPPSEPTPAPPPTVTKPEAPPPEPPPAATPIHKKWWLWAAVGGGVAAVALGVGLGVGLSGPSNPSVPGTSAGHFEVGF